LFAFSSQFSPICCDLYYVFTTEGESLPSKPSDSGCPRLTQSEAKTPEHNGRRKQLNQAVSAEGKQRWTV
jgi:hypothetical protein